MKPFISVIIPTYNRAHLVTDAINSVLDQTYSNFELLVVDDHSKDNTEEVVKSYDDPRVQYLINERTKGAQGARNTGLFVAKGEWIAFLDSDDVWLEDKLKIQLVYLDKQNEDVVGLSTGIAKYDFGNEKITRKNIPIKSSFTTKELLYKNYLGAGFSSFICKKEEAIEIGGLDEDFPAMQDMDFYIRLSQVGEIHAITDVLIYVRESNEDRISDNYDAKKDSSVLLLQKHKSKIGNCLRLKNRSISRIYLYLFLNKNIRVMKYLHWYFFGILVDFENFKWVTKKALSSLIRN
jgi:glycosyltransferase involved in cell wall biosynthesis